ERDVAYTLLIAHHEDRSGIAGPYPVGRNLEKTDPRQVDAGAAQLALRAAAGRGVVYQDVDALAGVQVPDDLGIHPWDGRKLAGPVVPAMRPGDPGRLMRFPFGRHVVAKFGGKGGHGHEKSVVTASWSVAWLAGPRTVRLVV